MLIPILIALVLLVVIMMRRNKKKYAEPKKGIVIYGTPGCIWCIRQKAYFDEEKIPYKFVDCTDSKKCPDGIQAFPTLEIDGVLQTPGMQKIKYPLVADETVGK
jgi:glutaredoxin